jgi:hypothetical protein
MYFSATSCDTTAQETDRPLPPGWHMTGQHNVDFSEGNFPVPLVKAGDDTNRDLEAFLQAAAGEGAGHAHSLDGTQGCSGATFARTGLTSWRRVAADRTET